MKILTGIIITASALSLTACGTTGVNNNAAVQAAALGAAAGAVAGKATGNHKDSRAVKGAAIGAVGGYIYGSQVEANKKKQRYNSGYGYY